VFIAGGFDGKFLGLELMLYGGLGHAVDSLADSVLESIEQLEQRLQRIEKIVSTNSN
jgi:hypothetical protein